jgi:hypothetical protein
MGYIFSDNPENTLRYVAAVLMAFGAKLVFERFANGDAVSVLIAGGATAFASFGYAAATVFSGYSGAMALAETVLAAGGAYFFKRTGTAFEHGKPLFSLSVSDRACVIMSAAIAASALSGIYFGKLNLGGIAASFIVITAAGYGKENCGAVAGTAVGTALALTSGNIGTVLAEYAAGGLFAGVFSAFGKSENVLLLKKGKRKVLLHIGIYQKHAVALFCKHVAYIGASGGFTAAAFIIGKSNYFCFLTQCQSSFER